MDEFSKCIANVQNILCSLALHEYMLNSYVRNIQRICIESYIYEIILQDRKFVVLVGISTRRKEKKKGKMMSLLRVDNERLY